MSKTLFRRVGLIVGALLVFVVASRYLTTDPDAFISAPEPPNPLPACPDSPNCVRVTWLYEQAPADLLRRAEAALRETGAATVAVDQVTMRIDAVYNEFVFKDDVVIHIEAFNEQAALHLRSASRVGYSDLGVNERRVRAIQDVLVGRTS